MVIAKNDFERYEIILPISALAGKRRKSYLCSELEKMHPCFSDEFCFDTTFKKISRKGLCTEVLVMSKNKLAEYEGKRHFSGNGFKLEGEKHHRFFIDTKNIIKGWIIFVCLLVAIVGLLSGAIAGKISSKKNVQPVLPGVAEEGSEVFGENIMRNSEFEFMPFIGELFIKNAALLSGKIRSFEWSIEGFTENLSVCIEGIYPEEIDQVFMPQNITYVNSVPKFTVSCIQKINVPEVRVSLSDPLPSYHESLSDFNVQMRNLLVKNGAVIKEEKTKPYGLLFSCSSKAGASQLFKELNQLIEKYQKVITFMRLSSGQSYQPASELMVELSIEESPVAGFNLNLIYENLRLFFEEATINQKTIVHNTRKIEDMPYINKKIGEIKRSDNSKVIFYKNQNGKMEKMIFTEEKNHD